MKYRLLIAATLLLLIIMGTGCRVTKPTATGTGFQYAVKIAGRETEINLPGIMAEFSNTGVIVINLQRTYWTNLVEYKVICLPPDYSQLTKLMELLNCQPGVIVVEYQRAF